jgi:hypothetical protein
MELDKILEKSDKLKQWYWDRGSKREGKYKLRMGQWLDDLNRLATDAKRINNAQEQKSCMAIWGPSQTGKSTLLASYIDGPKELGGVDDDLEGINSALTWSEDSPARFVGDNNVWQAADAVLNPYNSKADGSGCVTRFTLKDKVDHADFPVEVKFAERGQIMLALAVGWLSQTNCKKDNDFLLTRNELSGFYNDCEPGEGGVTPETFGLMVQVVNVLETLVNNSYVRYNLLREEWNEIRKQLLEEEKLISSKENIYRFASQVFWNGDKWKSITRDFQGLSATLDDIERKFGGGKVYSSYKVANILLNISALRDYTEAGSSSNEQLQRTKDLVDTSTFCKVDGGSILGKDGGEKLFTNKEYFGYFQALVWEVKVPLNKQKLIAISDHGPALELLEHAELLDFPGVANEDSGEGYSKEALEEDEEGKSLVLTQVLKRGKTESIVVSSSQEYNIDGFSLLIRFSDYPSKPDQLERGIATWYESFDQGTFEETAKDSDLPINLVLTFSGEMVNEAMDGMLKGMGEILEKLNTLRNLSNPDVVETFATNYPQFKDGRILVPADKLPEVLKSIMDDADFRKQFKEHSDALPKMTNDLGGKDYFLEQLAKQVKGSRRRDLVKNKRKKLEEEFEVLLTRALPGEGDEAAQRLRDIDRVKDSIDKALNESKSPDPGTEVGGRIQHFVSVDSKSLDDIPRNAQTRSRVTPIRPFLQQQLTNWKEEKNKHQDSSHALFGKSLVGLGDIDGDLANRILHYWGDAIDLSTLEEWFMEELGDVQKEKDRREFRRFLAIKISNLILRGGKELSPHPDPDSVAAQLDTLVRHEYQPDSTGYKESPFYLSIVKPFLDRLEELKQSSSEERPPQPGDNELLDLFPRS